MTKDIKHLRKTLSLSPHRDPKDFVMQYDLFINISDKTFEITRTYVDRRSGQQHQQEWMTTHQWKEGLTYEDLIEGFSNKGFVPPTGEQ